MGPWEEIQTGLKNYWEFDWAKDPVRFSFYRSSLPSWLVCYVCLCMLWIGDYQIYQHFKYIGLFCELGSVYAVAAGLLWCSVVKELRRQWGGRASVSGSGRSPVEGNGNPVQYSYLGNPMDWGAWQATIHGVPRVGQDLVTELPPLWAITASLQILHRNELCVELKIPWSGQQYIEKNPSDSAEIAFPFQKKID